MGRYRQPFTLFKRGKIWYYRLADDHNRTGHSTGKTMKFEAAEYAKQMAELGVQNPASGKKLADYLPDAFDKYVRMRVADGDPFSDLYIQDSRRYIRYIVDDKISQLELKDVTVNHVKDFKLRLLEDMKDQKNKANRILTLLKMLLREAYESQLISRDPSGGSRGVRRITVKYKKRQIYTQEQLEALFPPEPWEKGDYHPWTGIHDYTAFLTATCTGMRRKEVLGLKWSAVFLEDEVPYVVVVEELAKSKKQRATPIFDQVVFGDDRCVRTMKQLKALSSKNNAKITDMSGAPVEGYCFGYPDGSPRRTTWWATHLRQALDRAGIDRGGDEETMPLDGHSFRHTLATHLKSRGMPDGLVRSFCGWASLNIQTTYTHFDPSLVANYSQWISQHG